jgi:hypothetical protein
MDCVRMCYIYLLFSFSAESHTQRTEIPFEYISLCVISIRTLCSSIPIALVTDQRNYAQSLKYEQPVLMYQSVVDSRK